MTLDSNEVGLPPDPEAGLQRRVVPNKWERFLAGDVLCPLCSCCTWFGVGWFFVVLFVIKLAGEGMDIFSFDEQDVRSDLTVQQYHGFKAAVGDIPGCQDQAHEEEAVCKADEKCEWVKGGMSGRRGGGGVCQDKDPCPKPPPKDREEPLLYDGRPAWVAIIYEAKDDGNLLDDDMIRKIDSFERELLTTVDGAQWAGKDSPWDQDWCMKTYSTGGVGKCMPPVSPLNFFSLTADGLEKTARQVQGGFTNAGPLSCMCTAQDELCSICNADGTLKGQADWPTSVSTCMTTQMAAMAAAQSAVNTTAENAMCQQRGFTLTAQTVTAYLVGFCRTKPSCQWAPPYTSLACSSSGFYYATDTDAGSFVKGAEKDAVLDKMCNPDYASWSAQRRQTLPLAFDCVSRKTSYAKTTFMAGAPADGTTGDDFEADYVKGRGGWYMKEQAMERKAEEDGKLRVILFSAATIRSQFEAVLLTDVALSAISLFLVWLYMFYTLESAFLASCAMFEIVFSLPVACSLWTVFLQQKIEFFQMLTIYMILGIGADDAFILMDAWLQAQFSDEVDVNDRTQRFAWAYRRSFKAMLVTTTTTCGSFLIGACSVLPSVRGFCIFAAVVVLVDWLFCESFFASAVLVYDRFIATKTKPKGTCMGPGCCCGCVRVCHASLPCKALKATFPDASAPPEKRRLEIFCEGPLFNFLRRGRFFLIAFWSILTIAMVIVAGVALRTAEKRPPIGRESQDVTRGIELMLEHFNIGATPEVHIAWGLDKEEPIKEWGDTNDKNQAKLSLPEATKVAQVSGQMEILNLCRAADEGKAASGTRCDSRTCPILGKVAPGLCARDDRVWKTSGVYVPDDILCLNGRYCFMEEFARYWAYYIAGASCLNKDQAGCASPTCIWDTADQVCYSSKTEFDYNGLPPDQFVAAINSDGWKDYNKLRYDTMGLVGRDFDIYTDSQATGIRTEGSSVKFAWITYNATYPVANSVEQANDIYDMWDAFHKKYTPTVGGVQTTELYLFMVTQNEMVKASILGIVLSLLIAFVVLVLTTANWWVAALGLVNITCATLIFLGLIPCIGWSLGEYECIFLIAVVGLSVDYTVHLLHVYRTCKDQDRVNRSRNSLAEMGISVTNSAITTLLAAIVLFGCGFYFFFMFGVFIFLVIGFSIVMAIFFLIPITIVIGPQNTQGDIPFLKSCCRRRQKDGKIDGKQ